VAPSIILVHLRDDIYPDPLAFRPERFLETPPGTYTWIPFGGGMRRCIGAAFAQFEMRAVLRGVLSSVDLAPAGGAERISRRAITLVPRHGGRVKVERVLPAPERAGRRTAVAA
jgi:cytochrome P450